MDRAAGLIGILLWLPAAGCTRPAVSRAGPAQVRIVERAFPVSAATLRQSLLAAFAARSQKIPPPFREMRAEELKPPSYPPDWLEGFVDPGEFLKPYKQIPARLRVNDLLLADAGGDRYWPSEYVSSSHPAQFRCEFILHFEGVPGGGAIAQVFEKAPAVWTGMRWTIGHAGPGRYRDIRFVEPTVRDRLEALRMLEAVR